MKYTKREQREMAVQFAEKYKQHYGRHIQKEDIVVGMRFYIPADDCGGRLWFEVVEFEYDWRFQEELPVLWNERAENFELWPWNQICAAGAIIE